MFVWLHLSIWGIRKSPEQRGNFRTPKKTNNFFLRSYTAPKDRRTISVLVLSLSYRKIFLQKSIFTSSLRHKFTLSERRGGRRLTQRRPPIICVEGAHVPASLRLNVPTTAWAYEENATSRVIMMSWYSEFRLKI
jgi:hypothetical protein